ncbi:MULTISPECIES: hypothetical protein [unclassified Rhizobium]|uniref:hypothetical protein n=1 Tax=unclassified Rhizobium TaxID=2613769 RepID=UPI000BE9F544|nr:MULTISPECIES: hypothetical protein [unclassified Rhizobium]PDT07577.1 hypothetical protein CO655_26215 [Rhizobium sp. M1]PDT37910.1 hypothetical protein CO671_07185 [Rhizobium sp. M10]
MPKGLLLICGFAFALTALSSGATRAKTLDGLEDFKLGSSFADAQRNASEKGWRLRELSPNLPGQWVVEGSNLGLFICDDKIASIQQHRDGELHDFALLVQDFRIKYGEPETTIVTFPVGGTWISNIDARFASPSGEGVAVQLSSTAGKLRIHLNFFNANINCTTETKP